MRLAHIRARKAALSTEIQSFSTEDISDRVHDRFQLSPHEPWRRRVARAIAPIAVGLEQPLVRAQLPALPFFADLVTVGERFGSDASLAYLLRRQPRPGRVLVPGCYLGAEDVQRWLRLGARELDGIDVWSLKKRWDDLVPALERHYQARVRFQQASIEKLPFPDGTFDLVASSAVLEHVRNLEAMARETARVLRPGGWARHDFGPLYFTWGGDHCIAAWGREHGYDHLLLDEDAYQAKIRDQAFYDRQPDPNLPFWALREQFSFAAPEEHLAAFQRHFEIAHVVAKVSEDALAFRAAHRSTWRRLHDAGLSESTLLVKSLVVVLRKPAR